MPRSHLTQEQRIEAIREFNRFYIPRMGYLSRSWTNMLAPTEALVISCLCNKPSLTASLLAAMLNIDHGYLSRLLRKLESGGFITRKQHTVDRRQLLLNVTSKGRKAFETWSQVARQNVARVIGNMNVADMNELMLAMDTIMQLMRKHPPLPDETETA